MLKFSPANTKIKELCKVSDIARYLNGKRVYSLDLLSGWTCPFAKECKSKVHVVDNKKVIKDGPHTKFRCFSASQEVVFTGILLRASLAALPRRTKSLTLPKEALR